MGMCKQRCLKLKLCVPLNTVASAINESYLDSCDPTKNEQEAEIVSHERNSISNADSLSDQELMDTYATLEQLLSIYPGLIAV